MQEDEYLEERLASLRYELAAARVLLAAWRLSDLLGKANFNPNQPRVPRGRPDGGRWTREGSDSEGSEPADARPAVRFGGEDDPLEISRQRPRTESERTAVARRVAIWLAQNGVRTGIRLSPLGRFLDMVDAATWVYEYAPYIDVYLDPPKTLEELRRAAAHPRRGYQRHHIVEVDAARRDGFDEALIQAPENIVLIPTWKHQRVTGWFMRRNKDFSELAPRDYLRGKSWSERMKVGLEALIDAGVLKP